VVIFLRIAPETVRADLDTLAIDMLRTAKRIVANNDHTTIVGSADRPTPRAAGVQRLTEATIAKTPEPKNRRTKAPGTGFGGLTFSGQHELTAF
jgi:hypothetical protein